MREKQTIHRTRQNIESWKRLLWWLRQHENRPSRRLKRLQSGNTNDPFPIKAYIYVHNSVLYPETPFSIANAFSRRHQTNVWICLFQMDPTNSEWIAAIGDRYLVNLPNVVLQLPPRGSCRDPIGAAYSSLVNGSLSLNSSQYTTGGMIERRAQRMWIE